MAIQREYLSPNEIAEYLGVSPFTIRRYIKLGELRAVKLLGGFRVHRDELQKFLKAHEVNPFEEELLPEEVTAVPPAPASTPTPISDPTSLELIQGILKVPPAPALTPTPVSSPNAAVPSPAPETAPQRAPAIPRPTARRKNQPARAKKKTSA
ncbi:MAG: helix-turn-helix domain-containing protein [Anaerolineae bacterium]